MIKSAPKIVQNVKDNMQMNCSRRYNELIDNVYNIRNIWTSNGKVN